MTRTGGFAADRKIGELRVVTTRTPNEVHRKDEKSLRTIGFCSLHGSSDTDGAAAEPPVRQERVALQVSLRFLDRRVALSSPDRQVSGHEAPGLRVASGKRRCARRSGRS